MLEIKKIEQLEGLSEYLLNCNLIGFDFECTLDPHENKMYIISLATEKRLNNSAVENRVFVADMTNPLFRHRFVEAIRPAFECEDILKIAHNAIFDWKHLYHNGVYTTPIYCTMIGEQITQAGLLHSGFSLKETAGRRLGIVVEKEVRNNFINRPDDSPITQEELDYAALDAQLLLPIWQKQQDEIDKKNLRAVSDLENKLIPTTSKMEYEGVCIDAERLAAAQPAVRVVVEKSTAKLQDIIIEGGAASEIIFDRAGYSAVNVGSPKQLIEVFNDLGIGVKSLSKKELSDWDAKWALKHKRRAEDIDDDDDFSIGFSHPVLKQHGVRTAAAKLDGTYVTGLLERINPRTRRVHPGYKQCGAVATGRFSSVSPNFQNLPNKDKLDILGLGEHNIRGMFIPAPGRDFIISDYSGIELSILAAMSNDDELIHQILVGDIHSFVANKLAGAKIEAAIGSLLTPQNKESGSPKIIRDAFKPVSYGIIYGSTGYNLYRTLYFKLGAVGVHISQKDCDEWVDRWKHELFPGTGTLLKTNSEMAITRFYTESALGRKRFWEPTIRFDKWQMFAAMREGSNHPIQASCADMMKQAMYDFDHTVDSKRGRIVACIHDEILAESEKDYTAECATIVKASMEGAARNLFPNANPMLFTAKPKISDRYDK